MIQSDSQRELLIKAALLALGAALVLLGGPDVDLAVFAIGVFMLGHMLMWRPHLSPFLYLIFLYQWSQAGSGVIYASLLGAGLDDVAWWRGQHRLATFLMLCGVAVLAVCIRLGAGEAGAMPAAAWQRARSRPLSTYFVAYAVAAAASIVMLSVAPMAGGLRQPLTALAGLKWPVYLLLTLMVFSTPGRGKLAWAAVFLFEFGMSLGSYFSSFKTVFFYTLIAIFAAGARMPRRLVVPAIGLVAVLGYLALGWTAIKGDYREYLSGGKRSQAVVVSREEGILSLFHMLSALEAQDYVEAADALVRRISYHSIFGAVLDQVPRVVPHADGAIWGDAVLRPVTPRILFPDKTVIDDSALTNRYSGLTFAGAESGTSVSLGYMTESYIDFGLILMFVPVAALGLVVGSIHRWLATSVHAAGPVAASLIPFALMPAMLAETSAVKMVGALVITVFGTIVAYRILVPAMMPWLMPGSGGKRIPARVAARRRSGRTAVTGG